jgi:histidinol-phosphate aminotransferase
MLIRFLSGLRGEYMKQFVRKKILDLIGYETKNTPYTYKLDANEGQNIFFNEQDMGGMDRFHRYPDNESIALREEMASFLNIPAKNILAGNGSSEMIDLIMKTFIDDGDAVLSFTPSFSMYDVITKIYGGEFVGVPSNDDFSINVEKIIQTANEKNPKVILLCTPNNPTGAMLTAKDITKIIEKTNSIVVVDEAYVEFAEESFVAEINKYDNVIVLRTVSKAFGLASIRLGFMAANEEIIKIMKKVKPPYNLNSLSQMYGMRALQNSEKMKSFVATIKKEREKLFREMRKLGIEVFPSYANFLFFKSKTTNLVEKLSERGILIRKFSRELEGYYRVTVGLPEENKAFILALKEIMTCGKQRLIEKR